MPCLYHAASFSRPGCNEFAAQLHTEYARQSLLFRIDAEGLHLTRRDLLDLSSRAAASDNGLDDSATASSVTRLAGDISPQRSADLRQSANIQAAIPSAEWLDSDGTIIVVTQFEEPRLARVPQQGQLIHEAVLGQTSAYFLLRGPAKAVKVNVFLPDLAVTQSHDLRGTGAADKNDAEVSTQACAAKAKLANRVATVSHAFGRSRGAVCSLYDGVLVTLQKRNKR